MLTIEQKKQFSEILDELGNTLDISETQYNAAVKSYRAVGNWLSKEDSSLAPYKPEILPQGSFMLGTMIKPINDKDDLDIDLVCQLIGKNPWWTQFNLKNKVGDRLKAHDIYREMLDDEGRRCWTLLYSDGANYHMDILPCIVSNDYRMILEKAYSDRELNNLDNLAIRITCMGESNYTTSMNPDEWLKSNPFGYARWFFQVARLDSVKLFSLNESIQRVPVYKKEKLPLQRVVQILKRHRDMMFNGSDSKPISIIITTLAGRAYNKESDIMEALLNIVDKMPLLIEERYSPQHGRYIKWICNPVNDEENFADRWVLHPQREVNFYKWMKQLKEDVRNIEGQRGGVHYIMESLERPFGKNLVDKAFSNYSKNLLQKRETGNLKMASGTGILGGVGTTVKNHNFHGR